MAPRVIWWVRTDLRLHDNPALQAAIDLKPEALYPIWCWDSHYVYRARVGLNRWQFLIDCQNDLSDSINKLNKNNQLFVLREPAITLLPKLFTSWRISHLVFERDTDAYGKIRDEEVMRLAKEAGVKVITKSGRTLWDSDEIVKANNGRPTMSMHQLLAAAEKVGPVPKPIPAPKSFPDPGDNIEFDEIVQEEPPSKPDLNEKIRDRKDDSFAVGIMGGAHFDPPTMKELGFAEAPGPHKGGETVVLERLNKIFEDEEYVGTFAKPNTSPAAFEPQATCLTSPYLHFGALSCRYMYHRSLEIVEKRKKAKKPVTEPPTSLTGQLIFREMYFVSQAALGFPFAQTYNNPTCRFIPWHLPSKVNLSTGLVTGEYEIDDEGKEKEFQRWSYGKTGFPWIDAIMRQLRQEGWIHHLARHSVACFLTRGGCYISWERGAEVFEELLIDHEPACNSGNWQWLSCTAFFAQFYRCYSPVAFGKKWDKDGDYIRRYVPELANFPAKYIYEPHKAPIQDQKKAGVRIDGDGSETERDGLKLYPKPMFDFNTQREICIAGMKNAYAVGLYGNSKEVKDGTWKTKFDDDAAGPTKGDKGGPGGLDTWDDAVGDEKDYKSPATMLDIEKAGSATWDMPPDSPVRHKRHRSQTTLDSSSKKTKTG